MEIWKEIEGYEGLYEINNTGLVKSVDRIVGGGRSGIRKYKGKLKAIHTKESGHKIVMLWKDTKYSNQYIHRLVGKAFIPNPQNLPNVCHWDNDPSNNSIENLYWGTQSDNMQQMVRDGRSRNQHS